MSVSYSSRVLSAWMRMSSLSPHSRLRSAWTPISSHSRPRRAWMPISSFSPRSLSTGCLHTQTDEPLGLQLQSKKKKQSKKVCMVSRSSYEKFGDNPGESWSIFCVDLQSESESESFSLLLPKLRLCDESFDEAAFCILESTLYVFQGYRHITKSRSKFIYSYNLLPEVSNFKLEKRMMDKVGTMKNVKYYPVAVPTPDRKKILVYSRFGGHFELFNPKTGTCQKLPQINNCDERIESIVFHTFLSNYVLLIKVDHGKYWGKRSYILDFQLPPAKRSWKEYCSRFNEDALIFGNDLCLTAREGFNIDDEFSGWSYLYPEISSLPKHKLVSADCAITLIEEDGDVCELCILYEGIIKEDEFKYVPHIILDVYTCDVNVCREEMKRNNELKMGQDYSGANEWKDLMLPGVKKIKSLRFCLEKDYGDHLFCVRSFSTYN